MVSKSTLSKLKEFGLNSYEARIWSALLMKGTATAGVLSELADVPRSRCYDVLESLEKKGFIIPKLGRPIRYLAVSPEEAVDRVKEQLRTDLEEQLAQLESLKSTDLMIELNKIHGQSSKQVNPDELTGMLRNRKNIHNHLVSMMKATKQEVLLATDGADLEEKHALLLALANSGKSPKIRILTDSTDKELLERFSKIAQVRSASGAGKFCVTDGGAALFLTQDVEEANESALWIKAEPAIASLRSLFEAKWVNA